jgi:hypothetical protein
MSALDFETGESYRAPCQYFSELYVDNAYGVIA